MLFLSLQSGSTGNTLYVESRGVRLLFDAGLSAAQAVQRLGAHGRSPVGADALFISHEHSDHVRSAGIFARKFGTPVHITERTWRKAHRRAQLGDIEDVRHFRAGASVQVGHLMVHTVPTPHDAVDGSVFIVDDGASRLGICTDVGHVYGDLGSLVGDVDALFLESNYDEEMLRKGRYHPSLKRRIAGPGGHISNREAAELVADRADSRLQWLCLAHLSAENNTPELALAAHREALGDALTIHVASRHEMVGPMQVVAAGAEVPRTAASDAPEPRRAAVASQRRNQQLAFDFG
jgi:phosphoribosyl 1,2-cyclic phosphodiesterase